MGVMRYQLISNWCTGDGVLDVSVNNLEDSAFSHVCDKRSFVLHDIVGSGVSNACGHSDH